MSDLGELLELLQTAETRWRTVHATVRHEMDVELWARTHRGLIGGAGALASVVAAAIAKGRRGGAPSDI